VDAPVEGVPADDTEGARRARPGHPVPPQEPTASGGSPPAAAASPAPADAPAPDRQPDVDAKSDGTGSAPGTRGDVASGVRRPASEQNPGSWSDAPPPRDSAPPWAAPTQVSGPDSEPVAERTVDDAAISDDDESIDERADVGVPVVERLLGGTVISEDTR